MSELARDVYDSAGDHFDAAPLTFWDRYGTRTIERMRLARGAHVLDVCCGSGASVVPAAHSVGPTGSVLGIDITPRMLDLARARTEREGLSNVQLRAADMTTLELPGQAFDAVTIVFGLFFAQDMVAQLRRLASFVRPGGVLAVTVWGPRLFDPLYAPLRDAIRRECDLPEEFRPWDRVTTPHALRELFSAAELHDVAIEGEDGCEVLHGPEDWWTIVLGTGLRWLIDQVDPSTAARVRSEAIARARGVPGIETNVIYGLARL